MKSISSDVAEATLVILPSFTACVVILIETDWFASKSPINHKPAWESYLPKPSWLKYLRPSGNLSVTLTPVALLKPLFLTTIVQITVSPALTFLLLTIFLTFRSTYPVTFTVALSTLSLSLKSSSSDEALATLV